MKVRTFFQATVLMASVVSLILLPSYGLGQTGQGTSGTMEKSPESEAFDQKAMEKLKKMTPKQVEALDKRLAEALTFLYDREYARALPIFREISDQVETMDILFWFASCAAGAKDIELAETKFRQMLDIDSNLHRVRLELATVYFGAGRYDDARKELNAVIDAKPPKAVENNVKKLLAAIDEKTRRWFTNLRATLTGQRDSNVSAGPDQAIIVIPLGGGTIGPLSETQQEVADWVAVFNLAGNALYDMGKKGSWMWNSTGSFYNTHNSSNTEFDYLQWRVTTGPWFVGRKSVLKLPMGYAENNYEHDHLYDTVDVAPSYEYFFTSQFSLRGMFFYGQDTYEETFPPAWDKSGQDNDNRIMEINPNFFFNNRKDVLSFYLSDEEVQSKAPRFSYNAYNWAVSYFKRFGIFDWDMELYTRYKYSLKQYDTNALLWPLGFDRRDKRQNFYILLSRNFSRRYFASLSYNWLNNNSNTELYDYDKNIYALSVGFKY